MIGHNALCATAAEYQTINEEGDLDNRLTLSVTEEFDEAFKSFMHKHKVSQLAVLFAGIGAIDQLAKNNDIVRGKYNSVDWQRMRTKPEPIDPEPISVNKLSMAKALGVGVVKNPSTTAQDILDKKLRSLASKRLEFVSGCTDLGYYQDEVALLEAQANILEEVYIELNDLHSNKGSYSLNVK